MLVRVLRSDVRPVLLLLLVSLPATIVVAQRSSSSPAPVKRPSAARFVFRARRGVTSEYLHEPRRDGTPFERRRIWAGRDQ